MKSNYYYIHTCYKLGKSVYLDHIELIGNNMDFVNQNCVRGKLTHREYIGP